jgi:hypothetical protein
MLTTCYICTTCFQIWVKNTNICCWSSPAQTFLVSEPVGTHDRIVTYEGFRDEYNGLWIGWLELLALPLQLQSNITAHNKWLPKTRSIPYWTTSVFSSAWLTWFRFTNQSLLLLRLPWTTTVLRMNRSESESYVTTDGQSDSLSWNKAPIWGLRPDFYYCQTVAALLMWGVLSDKRAGLPFTIASCPRQRSHSRVGVPWDSAPYFTVSDSRFPFPSTPTTRRLRWRY